MTEKSKKQEGKSKKEITNVKESFLSILKKSLQFIW
jgi:hypothetical protein